MHNIVRAMSALLLAFAYLQAHAANSADPTPSLAPKTKYQLVYSAAVVQFEKPLSSSHVAHVVAEANATDRQGTAIGVDNAAKMLAGDTAYKVKNYARIVTGDGLAGVAANIETRYIYKLVESISPDGQVKTTTARAEPQRVGFDLTVSPLAQDNQPKNTVTNKAHIEHGVEVVGSEEVSTVVAAGESQLGKGSIQVVTWTNAGKAYALVLSLDNLQSVK